MKGLKHNLLSIIQMCDSGYKFTFDSKGCENRKEKSERLVAEGKRIDGNVYNLKECHGSQCMIGQVDESWLWYRRLGHINFDNLVKVSSKGYVRHLPNITKPVNTICDEYQKGKKTKEYSTTRPLELVSHGLMWPY